MTVYDLTRDQMVELKQKMLCDRDGHASWSDLADADTKIPDSDVFKEYEGTEFSQDDFSHKSKVMFEVDVRVSYDAVITVDAGDIAEAEKRVRDLLRPQTVFCDGLMNHGEDYEMVPHPEAYFHHFKKKVIPVEEA